MPEGRFPFQNGARRRNLLIALLFVALTLLSIGTISFYALLVVILDGVRAAVVLAPWALAGLWIIPVLRLGGMPLRWHLLIGGALGLGAASILALVLGSLGLLQRGTWIIILSAAFVAGLSRLALLLNAAYLRGKVNAPRKPGPPVAWRGVLLLLAPFATMALLAATTPLGLIWREEGFGYDILEYHLQAPKEYLLNGRISYLPHNVYGSFPLNVEMFYLLAMVLHSDILEVPTIANLIHLAFGVLTLFAAWVAGRQWSQEAGIIAAVLTGITGWLVYLSGLAYVENGVLFFGMTAAACIFRAYAPARLKAGVSPIGLPANSNCEGTASHSGTVSGVRQSNLKWVLIAGLLAGFSAGCKYTGAAFIVLPLGVAIFVFGRGSIRVRLMHTLIFSVGALASIAPWMIRNLADTGNPVFPLANAIFEGTPPNWAEQETTHWDGAHRPKPGEATLGGRLAALLNHTVLDPHQRFNTAAVLLAAFGLLWRRLEKIDAALLSMLLIQVGLWLAVTHLYARFLVPVLIPAVLLAGRAWSAEGPVLIRRGMIVVLAAAAAWHAYFSGRLMAREWPGALPASAIYDGEIGVYEYFDWVNDLPPDSKVLLIGEARPFYFRRSVDYWTAFNRNPFLEELKFRIDDQNERAPAEGASSSLGQALLEWLRARGYTHLLVNWSEVYRLTRTYQFSPPVAEEHVQQAIHGMRRAGLLRRIEPQEGWVNLHLGEKGQSSNELYAIPSG